MDNNLDDEYMQYTHGNIKWKWKEVIVQKT